MDSLNRIKQLLETTVPGCIAGFHVVPAQLPIRWDDNPRSVWQLICTGCRGALGQVLGYPFKDYVDAPDDPNTFISPIAFKCSTCNKVTEVIDTDLHGYHAEIDRRAGLPTNSVKHRGTGRRTEWACPNCQGELFGLKVAFVFWGSILDGPTMDQECFNVFLSFAECQSCGVTSQPTDFGKL